MHPRLNMGQQNVTCVYQKKIITARSDPNKFLDKRTELVSKCRHRNKFSTKQHLIIDVTSQLSGIMRSKS